MPPDLFAKYFEPAGEKQFRDHRTVRSRMTFHRHDLLSLKPIGENYNLIVCKNVLLHLQPAERVEVIKMFHRALAPGGVLATEQTQKLPAEVAPLFEQIRVRGRSSAAWKWRKPTPRRGARRRGGGGRHAADDAPADGRPVGELTRTYAESDGRG